MDVPRRCLLVTGADGFLGAHVVRRAIYAGYEVWRLGRRVHGERAIAADVTIPGDWQRVVQEVCPDGVIHLAGLTRGQDNQTLDRVHSVGTSNLIAALDGVYSWFAVASSGAVYGDAAPGTAPWIETEICRPSGAYAESKFAQERVLLEARPRSLRVCIVRISNLIGPGQSEEFFVGRIVNSIARLSRLALGERRVLETGSLAATRDFIDVRDASGAFLALLEKRVEGTFNLASGQETLLRDVAKQCLTLSGAAIRLRENPAMHLSTIKRQVLDSGALREATGWRPAYTLQQTLVDMTATAGELPCCQ